MEQDDGSSGRRGPAAIYPHAAHDKACNHLSLLLPSACGMTCRRWNRWNRWMHRKLKVGPHSTLAGLRHQPQPQPSAWTLGHLDTWTADSQPPRTTASRRASSGQTRHSAAFPRSTHRRTCRGALAAIVQRRIRHGMQCCLESSRVHLPSGNRIIRRRLLPPLWERVVTSIS
jgi:hypothetical protein